jgi:hypothetical protein
MASLGEIMRQIGGITNGVVSDALLVGAFYLVSMVSSYTAGYAAQAGGGNVGAGLISEAALMFKLILQQSLGSPILRM